MRRAVDLGDVDITGNEITEANTQGAIVFGGGNEDVDITGNTITDNEVSGIYFADGAQVSDDIDIKGNTISLNEGSGIEIAEPTAATAPTDVVIMENDIFDNEEDGIVVESWSELTSYIMFNDIHGNDGDAVDNNCDAGEQVNAYFNWWGSAVEDDFDIEGDVNYEPWLADAQEAVVSGSKVAVGANTVTSLDAETAAGVKVSGVEDDDDDGAYIICAAKYIANPQGAIGDAIAFYDVFVAFDDTVTDPEEVSAKLKFYDSAMTETSSAYFWTGDFWAECSDQVARAGLVWVTVTEDTTPSLEELEGTPFVVVAGPPVEAVAPVIGAPANGAADVRLTPTFSWGAVADADGYYFQLADNPLFIMPIVSFDGDLGRLVETAYTHVTALDYSTPYHWRVKAVSGTTEAGDLAESAWVSAVFTTMAEPVEPPPPIVIEEVPPPEITVEVEPPDVIVPLPAEKPITPGWIYAIIAVGGVLVIAVIVLIVRTRRVA
jgi:hypothetical protein